MELSSSNIKKIPYFFSKESFSYIFSNEKFSYISQTGTLQFSAQVLKKEIHPNKISYHSGNGSPRKTSYISGGNLESLKIKNFLYFSL